MPHFVKKFNINGVKTRQIPCIELHGRPNAATRGAVGVLGIDVDSPAHEMYKCVAVNGAIYTWEEMSDTASLPKIVNVLSNPSGDYSADASFEEIYKAHEAGKVVIALCDGSYYYLAGVDSERVRFTACVTATDGLSVGEITISTSENGDVVEYNLVSASGASSGTKIIPFTNMYMGTTSYCSTSVPFGEIYQAYLDGMTLVATAGKDFYYLSYISDTEVRFVRCHDTGGKATIDTMTLTSSQVASSSRNEPGRTKVVTMSLTYSPDVGIGYVSDTTPAEIAGAVRDGQVVVACFITYQTSTLYYLTDASESSATFSRCGVSDGKMVISTHTVDSNKNVTTSSSEDIAPTKVVTISSGVPGVSAIYASDTTLDEIAQAYSAGQVVLARITTTGITSPDIYYLTSVSTTKAIFSLSVLSGENLQVTTFTIDSDGNVTKSSGGAIEVTKVVTISSTYVGTGFSYTADITFAEIEQAVSAGQVVIARIAPMGTTTSPVVYYLTSISTTEVIFSRCALESSGYITVSTYSIDSNNSISVSSVSVYKGLPPTGLAQVKDETRITESGYYYVFVKRMNDTGGTRYYNFGVLYYSTTVIAAGLLELEVPGGQLRVDVDGKLTFSTIEYALKDDGVSIDKIYTMDGNCTIYLAKLS